MVSTMLELISVKKKYVTKAGETLALNDVSLRFPDRGVVFITGKSGSGKTTMLNILGGLDGFDEGEILVNGKSFSKFTPTDFDSYRNTYVGFIFQEYNLLPEYNVYRNVALADELQGKKVIDKENIFKLFEDVEIGGLENRKVDQLSGGQKQRVAIVRALAKSSKIILADELTGALDSVTGEQVMETLKKLSKEKLVIVVSHDLELAEKYADRIIKLVDGKVVEDITLTDIEFSDNLHDSEEQVTVKSGSELSEEEAKTLLKAIKQNRKIEFTSKIAVREHTPTVQPKMPEVDKSVKFINSKMKFSSTLLMGLKSLTVKPLRLIITILLSVIAFGCCGLFDAVASYNDAKVITGLLRDDLYSALPVYTTYTNDLYNGTQLKVTQKYIDSLNEKTDYKFRGVYDLEDTEFVSASLERTNLNAYHVIENLPSSKIKPVGAEYYYQTVNGMIEFKADEIEGGVIDKSGFNFKIVAGSYPKMKTGAIVHEVAISSYIADSIVFWVQSATSHEFGGKIINKQADLIGAGLRIADHQFTIVGIVDCGKIPAKYDSLKETENKSLEEDFATYLNAGCYLNMFVAESFVDTYRAQEGRTVCYYTDYGHKTQRALVDDLTIPASEYFYDVANLGQNVVYFDENKTQLAADEMLISVDDLEKEYFRREFDESEEYGYDIQLDSALWQLVHTDPLEDPEQYRVYMTQFLDLIRAVPGSASTLQGTFTKELTVRSYSSSDPDRFTDKKFKVVGIYCNVESDTTVIKYPKFDAFAVTSAGLDTLGIYKDQGIYSRMITPLYGNWWGEQTIGKMMDKDRGIGLSWFENSILGRVAADRQMVDQFLTLFLYITIVLALFSVFMLFNYISVSIMSKKQSIGVLRALGANTRNIFVMFLVESLIISLINGTIACLVGYLGCIFVNSYLVEIMNLSLKIAMFGFRQVAIILAGSLFAGIMSSIIPIVRVAKEKPVNLIRKL